MNIADRVQETTTTTGTGAVSMAGAVAGYQAFSAAFVTAAVIYYCIAGTTEWEVGIGTLTSGSPWTLSRDTVLASSNSGALVNFSAGTKNVFCDIAAGSIGVQAQSVDNLTIPDGANYMQLSRLSVTGRITLLGSSRLGVL